MWYLVDHPCSFPASLSFSHYPIPASNERGRSYASVYIKVLVPFFWDGVGRVGCDTRGEGGEYFLVYRSPSSTYSFFLGNAMLEARGGGCDGCGRKKGK